MPSESLTWQLCPVVRASFHAVLHSGIDAVSLAAAMQEFSQTVEGLRQAHQLLTASLFRYQAHLFLYLESVGTALAPDGLSPLLDALLCPWPAAVVLDLTLASAMIGEGTDYANLVIKDELNVEEYGAAFRKGSDVAAAVDTAFDELKADGTMQTLADKYGLTLAD